MMTSSLPRLTRRRLRRDRTVRRAIIAIVTTAVVAFTVVATGSWIVAHQLARRDALAEALRSAHVVANTVFAPLLPAVMLGSGDAINRLNSAVRIRSRDGSLVHVKVWKRDGSIIYSDDHAAIGGKFPLRTDVAETIDEQKSSVVVSDLEDPENVTESAIYRRLVEVYLPLNLDDGTKLAFEMYATDARFVTAERELTSDLVPFVLLALLILLITQLPVSVWLVRRVGRAQDEHSRLLRNSLTASGRERRAIAHDLHDGVVQDLASAGYAIDALAGLLPPGIDERSRTLVDAVTGVLRNSVGSLRTLMVDIYPPDLTADGLEAAIEDLADKLRLSAGVEVQVKIDLATEPSPQVAAVVYRCARECLTNIAQHAHASHVEVSLSDNAESVLLRLHDDGVGLPATGIDRRAEGHFGLQLLTDAAEDLGGHLRLASDAAVGTTVMLELPTEGNGLVDLAN